MGAGTEPAPTDRREDIVVRISSVVTWLTNIMLVAAIAAFAVFGLGPHTGTYRTLSILSGSMEPTFATGDAVISTPISTRELREGDVISYHAPVAGKPLVTHRVVKILRRGASPIVQTKGDANDAIDPWTAKLSEGTVWKQRASIPVAGHVTRALRHPAAKLVTVYALPLLIVGFLLFGIWRRPDAEDSVAGGVDPDSYDIDSPWWEPAHALYGTYDPGVPGMSALDHAHANRYGERAA